METKINCIALFGPTASGKTRLAVSLAQHCGGEIISADSMQIYRNMQIGTAKPTREEMQGVQHHLIDFLDPSETFSVARYVELANECAEKIHRAGKVPIIAGGTGLYIRSLLENLEFQREEENSGLRQKLMETAQKRGGEILLEQLAAVDPAYAKTLHPHNVKRIIRALELYQTSGVTMSQQIELSKQRPRRLCACRLALVFEDRQKLYDRINIRVDQMMEAGLLEEARCVFEKGAGSTAVQAIGYKELFPYFEGKISLDESVENIKRETRRYAKRQLTWIRREENIHYLYVDRAECPQELTEQALKIWNNFLELKANSV